MVDTGEIGLDALREILLGLLEFHDPAELRAFCKETLRGKRKKPSGLDKADAKLYTRVETARRSRNMTQADALRQVLCEDYDRPNPEENEVEALRYDLNNAKSRLGEARLRQLDAVINTLLVAHIELGVVAEPIEVSSQRLPLGLAPPSPIERRLCFNSAAGFCTKQLPLVV